MLPTISGRMIMSRRGIFTTLGFSSPWAAHLSRPGAAASAASAASSAGCRSATVAGARCIAASVAHRTCPAAGRGLRCGR